MGKNQNNRQKKRIQFLVFSVAGVLCLGVLWVFLPSFIGEKSAMRVELTVAHLLAPDLTSDPLPKSAPIPTLRIELDKEKGTPDERKATLLENGTSYPVKLTFHQISTLTSSFYSLIDVSLRKDKNFHGMQLFSIVPPVSPSQVADFVERELARNVGFDETSVFTPVFVFLNNHPLGLRYISARPELGSMELESVPYLKMFCRVRPEDTVVNEVFTGAKKSKGAVGPESGWSIAAPTLGEGVTGPEFVRLKALALQESLSKSEEESLRRIVDASYFGKYAAIKLLSGTGTIDALPIPPSFRFDHVSGRIRPSFQYCSPGGLFPRSENWFESLMQRIKLDPEFIASFENTFQLLAKDVVKDHLFVRLLNQVQREILPAATATPYRYALLDDTGVRFVYRTSLQSQTTDLIERLSTIENSSTDSKNTAIRASLNPKSSSVPRQYDRVLEGARTVDTDIVVGKNESMLIKAGATLQVAAGASILISGGELTIEGEAQNPVQILNRDASPWGGLLISNGGHSSISHAKIKGGSEAYREFVRYDGTVSAHNSVVEIQNSRIEGLVSFQKSKVQLSEVEFVNLVEPIYLSTASSVSARNVVHTQLKPAHTAVLLDQVPHGVPHTEREFKYTIDADWKSPELLEAAVDLQQHLKNTLKNTALWKAPQYSRGNVPYRVDEKVGEFAYTDIYIDTPDLVNYQHDVSYRFRYRFENRKAFDSYIESPTRPRTWPFRLEYQGKIGRGHPAPGFSEVYEARYEFRKQSAPYNEENLSPWAPWDISVYLPYMLNGSFKNVTTVSGAEVERYLIEKTGRKDFSFEPNVVVVTERLRQHLNIPTEWGSGPNPDQSNIITFDRSEILSANEFIPYFNANRYGEGAVSKPAVLGVVTEMEIEYERNVSRELDKKLEIARQQKDSAEIARLTNARQAFLDDLVTLRSEIVRYFKTRGISLIPGDKSKYLQSYEILQAAQKSSPKSPDQQAYSARRTYTSAATPEQVGELIGDLESDPADSSRKFVFSSDQVLVVSTVTGSDSSHAQLGKGRDIQAAGYLGLKRENGKLLLNINNRSEAYCPTVESLTSIKEYLANRSSISISINDQPNEKCALRNALLRSN